MATRYSYPIDLHEESDVRRMLDPHHATEIGRLGAALARFGTRLVITVETA